MKKRYQLFVDEVIRRRKDTINKVRARKNKERDPDDFVHDDFMYIETKTPGVIVSFQKFVRFFLSLDRLDLSYNWVLMTMMDMIIEENVDFIRFLRDYSAKKYREKFTRRGNFFDLPALRKPEYYLPKIKRPFRKVYNFGQTAVFYPGERRIKEIEAEHKEQEKTIDYLTGNVVQIDETEEDAISTTYEENLDDYLNFDELLKDFQEDEEDIALSLEDIEKADEEDEQDQEKSE